MPASMMPSSITRWAFRYGLKPGVFFLSYAARPLWLLGFPDQARTRIREAF